MRGFFWFLAHARQLSNLEGKHMTRPRVFILSIKAAHKHLLAELASSHHKYTKLTIDFSRIVVFFFTCEIRCIAFVVASILTRFEIGWLVGNRVCKCFCGL